MTRLAIPYCTGAGHTERLVQEMARGADTAGVTVDVLNVEPLESLDWSKLHSASAIIFAAPTYMGSAAGAFKLFMDEASEHWLDGTWRDKIAAGATVGSAPSGDKSLTLMSFTTFAAQMGMIWVGQAEIGAPANPSNAPINQDGFWLGLAATASRDKCELITPADAETAQRFGARIAEAAARWGSS